MYTRAVFKLFAFHVKWVDICYFSSSLSLSRLFIHLSVRAYIFSFQAKPFRRLFYLLFPFDLNHSNRLPCLKIHLNNCDIFPPPPSSSSFFIDKTWFSAQFLFHSFMNWHLVCVHVCVHVCLCPVSFVSLLERQSNVNQSKCIQINFVIFRHETHTLKCFRFCLSYFTFLGVIY